jgi:hypothetical protein
LEDAHPAQDAHRDEQVKTTKILDEKGKMLKMLITLV